MEKVKIERIISSDTIISKKKQNNDHVSFESNRMKQKDPAPITVCIPWEQKRKEIDCELENEELLRRVWQDSESMAHMFIWHCLVSF